MKSCINSDDCICKRGGGFPSECIEILTICEKGKSLTLTLKSEEEAIVIILDKCIITDNKTKSDALYLYKSRNKKVSFLIELKGFGEIEKAFTQLSFTKNRDEYREIIECFKNLDGKRVYEKFIIVTNGILKKHEQESLENENNIRVRGVLFSDSSFKIPNLRDYL